MFSFDLAHFAPNLLTIPMAMVGMTIFGFGVWVLTVNRGNRLHRDFFILCCLLTGWLLSQAVAFSALRPQEAIPLYRMIWPFVLFIAPATFALNMSLLGYQELRERLAPLFHIVAAIFVPTILTNLFVDGSRVDSYPYALVPSCGPINVAYLVIFVGTFVLLLGLHWRRMRNPLLPPRDRGIYRLIFAATVIGSLGLIDWLQCLGAPVPPVGFVGVFFWIAIFAYAIFRYRIFQLTVAVATPTVVEALPGALFVTGLGGEIVIVNPGALAMTGQTEPALLGRGIRDFLPAAEKTLECALLKRDVGDCAVDGLDTRLTSGGGKDIPVSLSARVIRRPDGVPNGAIFIAVEISRLKEQAEQAERQKEEQEQILEEMRQAQKLLVDRENRMIEIKNEINDLKKNRT